MGSETKCVKCGKYNGTADSAEWCQCPRPARAGVSQDTPTPTADGEAVDFEQAKRVAHVLAMGGEGLPPRDYVTIGRAHLELGKRLQACGDALSVAALRARPALPADVTEEMKDAMRIALVAE